MEIQGILKKLRYKADKKGVILNAPVTVKNEFKKAGFSTTISGKSEFTILFVRNISEFKKHFKSTTNKIENDSLFWLSYPKGSSSIKTDVNRDILWKLAEPFGYRPVSQVAIDSDWSAMRFRPIEKVKSK
jgi:hypothetical protein